MKTKKIYNPPITEMVEVEFEGGFMADSVYKTSENTEALNIENQEKGAEFDFSSETEWK